MNSNARIERLPQDGESKEVDFPDIYAAASNVAKGVLESMQKIAGTTYCKGVQVAELEKWAKSHNCWFDKVEALGTYIDRGSENEVYVSNDGKSMFKLNDFRYSDDNLDAFFERVKAHNYYFPDCAYTIIGFSRNQEGNVCALLKQPFIVAEREATDDEIKRELLLMGFESEMDGEYFKNNTHEIFDITPNNVLMGVDGRLYFIDTIIYLSDSSAFDKYKSLSPRYSN